MLKKLLTSGILSILLLTTISCSNEQAQEDDQQVVIFTNSDDEVISAMQNALNNNGYEGQYIIQSFGTAELGGKLMAEGKNIQADIVTMSSYYLESSQDKNQLFVPLTFSRNTLEEFPDYYAPITKQEGAMIVNTQLIESNQLPRPTSFKELSDPVYLNHIAIADPKSSSTSWLMLQAIIDAYGDQDEGKAIMHGIIHNAGDQILKSGSAPLKAVRSGEVTLGFGLRQQVVADKVKGLPIDFIDPTEGNFSLVEGIAIIDKGEKTRPELQKIVETVVTKGRPELIESYPNELYEGEKALSEYKSAYPREFKEALTVDLLAKHLKFYEESQEH